MAVEGTVIEAHLFGLTDSCSVGQIVHGMNPVPVDKTLLVRVSPPTESQQLEADGDVDTSRRNYSPVRSTRQRLCLCPRCQVSCCHPRLSNERKWAIEVQPVILVQKSAADGPGQDKTHADRHGMDSGPSGWSNYSASAPDTHILHVCTLMLEEPRALPHPGRVRGSLSARCGSLRVDAVPVSADAMAGILACCGSNM